MEMLRRARLLARGEGLDGEGLGDAGEAPEDDLAGGRVVDGDLVDRRPQHELLGLDALELLDALGLDVAGDLHVVAHLLAHHLEAVLYLLLLRDPHVVGGAHEADLGHVRQW